MAEYISLLTLQIARGFEGCERFEIYASASTPGEVLFLEHWTSEQASQAYGRWRTERGDMDRLGAFFSAAPKSTILRCI